VSGEPGIAVLDGAEGPELALVEGEGSARAIVWPGSGARLRSLQRIALGAGARTIELRHPSEAVYYVVAGGGWVAEGPGGERQDLVAGSMFHVDPGTPYLAPAGADGMDLVGGPSPADDSLYEGAREG
jgi:quercetin dioxygenase-like cupin family protein